MSEPARDSECRFTPAWQPGADANLQRAGKQPSAATCDCGHPQGWHRKNVGSCIECACPYFDDRDEQATDRSAACTCLGYVDESGRPTGEPIALSRCETHPLPASRFKVWATGLNNWHVHAKHPVTGSWATAHGLYSETAAMLKGDSFCDKLDAEAERAAA